MLNRHPSIVHILDELRSLSVYFSFVAAPIVPRWDRDRGFSDNFSTLSAIDQQNVF